MTNIIYIYNLQFIIICNLYYLLKIILLLKNIIFVNTSIEFSLNILVVFWYFVLQSVYAHCCGWLDRDLVDSEPLRKSWLKLKLFYYRCKFYFIPNQLMVCHSVAVQRWSREELVYLFFFSLHNLNWI